MGKSSVLLELWVKNYTFACQCYVRPPDHHIIIHTKKMIRVVRLVRLNVKLIRSALYFEFLALALDRFKAGADVMSLVPSFLVAGGPMRLQLCSTPHIPDPLLVDPRPSPLCAGTPIHGTALHSPPRTGSPSSEECSPPPPTHPLTDTDR